MIVPLYINETIKDWVSGSFFNHLFFSVRLFPCLLPTFKRFPIPTLIMYILAVPQNHNHPEKPEEWKHFHDNLHRTQAGGTYPPAAKSCEQEREQARAQRT